MTMIEVFLLAIITIELIAVICNNYWQIKHTRHSQSLKSLERMYEAHSIANEKEIKNLTEQRDFFSKEEAKHRAKYFHAFSELEQLRLKQLKTSKRSSQSKDVPDSK